MRYIGKWLICMTFSSVDFLKRELLLFNERLRKKVRGVTREVEEGFRGYRWSGNVRELRNVIERVMILEESDLITTEWLPRGLITDEPGGLATSTEYSRKPPENNKMAFHLPDDGVDLEQFEFLLVRQAMERAGGNQTRASELLGLSRDQLRYRLKKIEDVQD
jgi:two-component system, NtrC family, response regulator AtoC